MDLPLVQHGPSPSYGTAYYYADTSKGSRIIAVDRGNLTSSSIRKQQGYQTLLDRIFKIDRVIHTPAAEAAETLRSLPSCETPKRKPRRTKFVTLITTVHQSIDRMYDKVNQLALFGRSTLLQKDHTNEPHTKTTRSR